MGEFLIAADVQGAARVANHTGRVGADGLVFVGMADGLRAVDMSKGHIVEPCAQVGHGNSL